MVHAYDKNKLSRASVTFAFSLMNPLPICWWSFSFIIALGLENPDDTDLWNYARLSEIGKSRIKLYGSSRKCLIDANCEPALRFFNWRTCLKEAYNWSVDSKDFTIGDDLGGQLLFVLLFLIGFPKSTLLRSPHIPIIANVEKIKLYSTRASLRNASFGPAICCCWWKFYIGSWSLFDTLVRPVLSTLWPVEGASSHLLKNGDQNRVRKGAYVPRIILGGWGNLGLLVLRDLKGGCD